MTWKLAVMLFCTTVVALVSVTWGSESCNEALCASMVTKCMLLKSCECDMTNKKNCTCCMDCQKCLSDLYTECCSCVGMCAKNPNLADLARTSTIEKLTEPIPDLFDIFTSEPDEQQRWTTYTYSAHFDLLGFTNQDLELDLNEEHRHRHEGSHRRVDIDTVSNSMNCTVAYMSQCMSLTKCKDSCNSIGASSYRWFHEYGCCECIGHTCLDFGNAEAMCVKCGPGGEREENSVEPRYDENMQHTHGNNLDSHLNN